MEKEPQISPINKIPEKKEEELELSMDNMDNKEVKLEKYESAIRKFFQEQYPMTRKEINENIPDYNESSGLNITGEPDIDIEDMKKLEDGTFIITNFQVSLPYREEKSRRSFHFNIGNMRVHITEKAADRVYELLEGENK